MREEVANSDWLLAKVATRQHGVVSSRQLGEMGIDKDGITRRVRAGRLSRLHRGVYAAGHSRLTFEGRCMAAMLALGDGAVVSHRSAAVLWGLLKPTDGPIHVTLSGDAGRKHRPGITIHRSVTLSDQLATRRQGIPVTNAARTLRDLRRAVPQPVYRAAVRKALDRRLIRSAGIPEADLTRSELERMMLRLCRRHRFPQPEVNARVDRYEVDFVWRDRRVIVETDSWRHHGDRGAFEADRARDARLQTLGYRVLRFTWRQIGEDPDFVARALRALLGPIPLFRCE